MTVTSADIIRTGALDAVTSDLRSGHAKPSTAADAALWELTVRYEDADLEVPGDIEERAARLGRQAVNEVVRNG